MGSATPAEMTPVTVWMAHPEYPYVLAVTAKFDRAPSGKSWAAMCKRYTTGGRLAFASVAGRWESPEDALRGQRAQVTKSTDRGWFVIETR